MMARRWREYELTLPGGEKRFEIVDLDCDQSAASQLRDFAKMHGATGWKPTD